MKLHSIISAIVIVATTSASADVLNVEVLDLDAPREEPPTVVPTRPPDDPEPVDEPYEWPTLPGPEEVTNRLSDCSRAVPVDEILVASLPGYEFSTNRLAAALYVLSCTNSWTEQNAYFIGVTNAIENAQGNQ